MMNTHCVSGVVSGVRGLRRSIILPPGTDGQCMARVWPGKRRIIHCTGDKAVRILVVLLHTGVGVGGVLMQHALVDRHWSIECTTQGSVHKCIHKRNLFPLHVSLHMKA